VFLLTDEFLKLFPNLALEKSVVGFVISSCVIVFIQCLQHDLTLQVLPNHPDTKFSFLMSFFRSTSTKSSSSTPIRSSEPISRCVHVSASECQPSVGQVFETVAVRPRLSELPLTGIPAIRHKTVRNEFLPIHFTPFNL